MAKFCTRIIAILSIVAALTACERASEIDRIMATASHFPVKLQGSDKWSLLTPDGKIVAVDGFESEPAIALDGVFGAFTDCGISIYTIATDGTLAEIPNATGLRYAGAFAEGLIPICHPDSAPEIIDRSGNRIFSLSSIDGRRFNACHSYFCNGLLPVRETGSGLWGAVDAKGNLVVKPKYAYLGTFNRGVALATDANYSDTVIIVDKSGDERVMPDIDQVQTKALMPESSSASLICVDGKSIKVLDANGKTIYTAPSGVISIEALPGAKGYLQREASGSTTLLSTEFKPILSLAIAKTGTRTAISSIILSDNPDDHRMFNTADPGDDIPAWMEAGDDDDASLIQPNL